MQQPYLLGVRSAQAMFDHLDGKTPPKEILVPIIVVSQKNLDEADDDLQMRCRPSGTVWPKGPLRR